MGTALKFPITAALLLLAGLLQPAALADEERSEPAKLAAKSLLLDITHAGQRMVSVGERGHVLISDDQGMNWRQVLVPTRSQLTAVFFIDDSHGWAVGHDSVILHTSNGGEQWTLQHRDQQYDDPLMDIWFRDPQHGFAVGAYGLFLSTDNGGKSWDRRQISDDDYHLNAITELPDGGLVMAAEQGHLYLSDDGGYNWNNLSSPYGGSWFGVTAAADDTLIVFGLRGHLFRSTNRGNDWCEIETGTESSLMASAQSADGSLVVVGLGGTILTSNDYGRSFSARTRADRKSLTGVLFDQDNGLVLSGAAGINREPRP